MKVKIGNRTNDIPNIVQTCITGDALDLENMYGMIYDHYPIYRCEYTIHRINEDEDESEVFFEMYKELTSKDFTTIRYDCDYIDDTKKCNDVNRFYIASNNEAVAISYEYSTVTILTHLGIEKVNEVIDKYLKKYNQDNNNEVKCYIIVKENEIYLKDFTIKLDNKFDYDLYNDGFIDVHNNIVKSIKEDKNGLYLLYGSPGTGKTTYIRHLIKECETEKRKFVYVPSNLFGDFTNPSLISFLMNNRGCVFIIEDCESLVTVDNGIRSNELTDLLNMTDGILADALDIKIICTFNIDDGKIDEALLRPGRCRCRYEFGLLEKEKANNAAKKYNLNSVEVDTSLADLFNTGKNYLDKKKKMGFR